jgi:hypothetical protein
MLQWTCLETTCFYWQVRQTIGKIAFDAHTFPCVMILNVTGFPLMLKYSNYSKLWHVELSK